MDVCNIAYAHKFRKWEEISVHSQTSVERVKWKSLANATKFLKGS